MLFRNSLALIALWFCSMPVQADKTDVVILNNGDRVTGEIKKLEAGLLEYSTDTMGTIYIEWRFIRQILSDTQQTIETTDGQRLVGKLQKPAEGEDVQLITFRGPVELEPGNVVAAWPVEAGFLDKMDLDVSVGYDYAKSTGITNFNVAADFLYRTEERIFDSSFRSYVTSQDQGGDDQNRQEGRFNYQRLLQNQKYRNLLAGFDVNEAIGLDLRVYAGGGFGRYLQKTNRTWFTIEGGAIATQEHTVAGETTESLELSAGLRYRYFRYADPRRTLDTSLFVFPSLTESGRWRADARTTFKLELIQDLFWTMEFYGSYDSEPIDLGAETTDYGITTGLGWSF